MQILRLTHMCVCMDRADRDYYLLQDMCYSVMNAVRKNQGYLHPEVIASFVNIFKAHNFDECSFCRMVMWCTEDIPYGTSYFNAVDAAFDLICEQLFGDQYDEYQEEEEGQVK